MPCVLPPSSLLFPSSRKTRDTHCGLCTLNVSRDPSQAKDCAIDYFALSSSLPGA